MTKTTSISFPIPDALNPAGFGTTAMGPGCGASWWGFVHHHVE